VKIAFVVAEPRALKPSWGSAYLAGAAMRRGHDVGFVGVDDLTLADDGRLLGAVVRPKRDARSNEAIVSSLVSSVPISFQVRWLTPLSTDSRLIR